MIFLALAWLTGMLFLFRRMKWRPTRLLRQLVVGEKTGSPFRLYSDYDELVERLLPNLQGSSLQDRAIPYVDRKRQDMRLAFRPGTRILIRGCTKRGKTRELLEILRENWPRGLNVLVPQPGSSLENIDPTILSQLPTRNVVLILDDLHYYFSQNGKQTLKCIEGLERHCGSRSEVIVVATARDEADFRSLMQYNRSDNLWKEWQQFELQDVSVDEATQVIRQVSGQLSIHITGEIIEVLARKNDGTFLNIVLAFREWAQRHIESLDEASIEKFQDNLKSTWNSKWRELQSQDRYVELIGSAIRFLYDQGLPIVERVVIDVAFWQRVGITGLIAYASVTYALGRMRNRVYNIRYPWRKSGRFQSNPILRSVIVIILTLSIFMCKLLTAPIRWLMRQYDVFVSKRLWRALARVRAETPHLDDILIPYEAQVESFFIIGDDVIFSNEKGAFAPSNRFLEHVLARHVLTTWIDIYASHRLFDAAMRIASRACDLAPDDEYVALVASDAFEAGNDLQRASKILGHIAAHDNSLWRARPLAWQAEIDFKQGNYRVANRIVDALSERFPAWRSLARFQTLVKYKLQNPAATQAALTRRLALKPAAEEIQALQEWLVEQPEPDTMTSINGQLDQYTRQPIFRLRTGWQKFSEALRKSKGWKVAGAIFSSLVSYILICLILLGLAFVVYSSPELVHSLRLDTVRGSINLMFDKYTEAVRDYTAALETTPDDATALAHRGQAYRMIDNYDQALADLNRAIELRDDIDLAFAERGEVYLQIDQYSLAIADFTKAIELNPTYRWAFGGRGVTYAIMGKRAEALADLNTAIDLKTTSARTFATRGSIYIEMGKYAEAVADLNRAIDLDSKWDWPFIRRGDAYRLMNRDDLAFNDYAKAVEISSDNVQILTSNGHDFFLFLHETERAFRYFNRAVELAPENATVFASRGNAYLMLGQMDKAQADMQRALELEPDNSEYKSVLLQIQDMRQTTPTSTP